MSKSPFSPIIEDDESASQKMAIFSFDGYLDLGKIEGFLLLPLILSTLFFIFNA